MLLAVPLTMMLKVVLEASDGFRWIGVAISSDQPREDADTKHLEISDEMDGKPADRGMES
jgi:AI-2 transport protein TqsA